MAQKSATGIKTQDKIEADSKSRRTRMGGARVKVGRPKKYKSARALERGIERYFDSISYEEPVFVRGEPMTKWDEKQQANVPLLDDYGHKIYEEKPLLLKDGTRASRTIWIATPSIEAMCLYLGISTTTWASYEKNEEFLGATSRARGRILAYLQERLDSGKGTNGAKFRLSCMHGWSEGEKEQHTEPVKVIIDV